MQFHPISTIGVFWELCWTVIEFFVPTNTILTLPLYVIKHVVGLIIQFIFC